MVLFFKTLDKIKKPTKTEIREDIKLIRTKKNAFKSISKNIKILRGLSFESPFLY